MVADEKTGSKEKVERRKEKGGRVKAERLRS
jgi:hypothetical protein